MPIKKAIFVIPGVLSLLLGVLGIFLPLLPTVPFLLLSAYCFSRSSTRLHRWLIHHPTLGPPIQRWQAHGAISLAGKRAASVAVAVTLLISLLMNVAITILIIQVVVLSGVMIFIWSRPTE